MQVWCIFISIDMWGYPVLYFFERLAASREELQTLKLQLDARRSKPTSSKPKKLAPSFAAGAGPCLVGGYLFFSGEPTGRMLFFFGGGSDAFF